MSDIPDVNIDSSYSTLFSPWSNKYILAQAGDRTILWAPNVSINSHKKLVDLLESSLQRRVNCLGGGMLYISAQKKQVFVWDESVSYGAEDREVTIQMLQKHFPELSVVEQDPNEKV